MNELHSKYTLEKHLKTLSEEDEDYELLYSIWSLNKKNLMQGLNLVSNSFPHYSMHDMNHSMTIIDNIQCVLGEERVKHLGATDTFLILMAGLTHDIGMILTYNMLEREWQKDDFKEILKGFSSSIDHVIADAANLLLSFNDNKNDDRKGDFKWALEIKNAVVILTAEIFRSKHAKQSADNLLSNNEFKKLAENFHADQLPNRFMELLANIAFLHGENFDRIISDLYQTANGYKGDYMHPRFIACMIRLGDLLDFDNNRFNSYSIATIKEMPETSFLHQQKHAAVKHMLISPNAIEAELNCTDEKVYRIARSWFDWLEDEVNNQNREWTNIAPKNLGGLPPIISKNSIKILYNGIQAPSELLNLKFFISQKKMFSILQGGGIYKEPGLVFIREIVQNAFDAVKIQLWKDIKAGNYDYYLNETGKDTYSIKFPDDISPSIYRQYRVKLQVKWKDKEKNILHVECSDNGIGISEATLLRMTKYVGESYKKDNEYTNTYNEMPYWLKPTAAFGIGLQSVFFVSPTFEVETNFPGETTKCIIFRSAADDQYSSIVAEYIERKRGTTVKVDILKDKFKELFGSTFNWDVLNQVNVFENDNDNLYLAKIDHFVRKTFFGIENINFSYESENPSRNFHVSPNNTMNNQVIVSENYKCSYEYQDGYLIFKIYEKVYGSTFTIWFCDDFRGRSLYQNLLLRDVLVSNAKLGYYKTAYIGFNWNLNNQATDKVVDLSRDNLTYTGRQWITNTLLKTLLPESLKLIGEQFAIELGNASEDILSNLKVQYLNYSLTALACHVNTYNLECLHDIEIPNYIATLNDETISAKQLFESQYLYLVRGFKTNGYNIILPEEQKNIKVKNQDLLSNNIVVWGNDYLHNALIFNYTCVEIIKYGSCQIYKLEKNISERDMQKMVKYNDYTYLSALEMNHMRKCSRATIYGLEKYKQIVVNLNYISGFEYFPDYSTCCIYTPFSNKKEIDELLDEVKGKDENEIRNYVSTHLTKFIPPYLIQIVETNNINKDISEAEIREGYISLICDFIRQKMIKVLL